MKRFAKRAAFLLVFVFVLTACGKVDTGIQGKVFLANCTGSQIATSCVGTLPYQAKLDIYDQNVKKIKTITTKQDGTFLIGLKPGTYFIHPENSGKYPIAADFRVTVTKGQLADMTIYYDTGVR